MELKISNMFEAHVTRDKLSLSAGMKAPLLGELGLSMALDRTDVTPRFCLPVNFAMQSSWQREKEEKND